MPCHDLSRVPGVGAMDLVSEGSLVTRGGYVVSHRSSITKLAIYRSSLGNEGLAAVVCPEPIVVRKPGCRTLVLEAGSYSVRV